jgi:uridine kinase
LATAEDFKEREMTEDIDFERWYRELYYKFTIIRDHVENLNLMAVTPDISELLKLQEVVNPDFKYDSATKEQRCQEVSKSINAAFDAIFR